MDKPVEREKLYAEIKKAYAGGKEMTARECAEVLKNKGIVHFGIRQETQPRLTEMVKLGWFETIGSKYDLLTQKTVTVYRMVESNG